MRATCNLHFPETRCSFLPKSKPRLCLRLISPISPICPNPETRSLASASPKPRLFCAIVKPPLFFLGSISSIASISSTCNLRSLCAKAKLGGRSHHPHNLQSLFVQSGTWQAFSPPRNLSAFSAFFATDGFLRPWKTIILTFVYIFRYGVGVLSDRKHRAVGGSLTRQVKGISLYNPLTA